MCDVHHVVQIPQGVGNLSTVATVFVHVVPVYICPPVHNTHIVYYSTNLDDYKFDKAARSYMGA